jgi:hypothetical protein
LGQSNVGTQLKAQPLCGIFPEQITLADIVPNGPYAAVAGLMHDGVSIPVKWGTDSGEVGQRQSKATLAMAMISEVPHLSQEVRGS